MQYRTDIFHEPDSTLHSKVINAGQVVLLGLHTEELFKDIDDDGLMEESATEELSFELDAAQEASLET